MTTRFLLAAGALLAFFMTTVSVSAAPPSAPLSAPLSADAQLFEALDLSQPTLADVKRAADAHDIPAAKHALAEYFRHRTSVPCAQNAASNLEIARRRPRPSQERNQKAGAKQKTGISLETKRKFVTNLIPGDCARGVLLPHALGTAGLSHADFFSGGPATTAASKSQLAEKNLPPGEMPALLQAASMTAQELATRLVKADGAGLSFGLRGAKPENVTLKPFYEVHFERYALYWPIMSAGEHARRQAEATASFAWEEAQAAEEKRPDLEAVTVDRVLIGDVDSERAHSFAAERSNSGGPPQARWRDASGWFSYAMKVRPDAPLAIRARYYGGDIGRAFDIAVDGKVIATEQLTGRRRGAQFGIYPIPPEITRGKDKVTVRFEAKPGSLAGGLYDLRVVLQPLNLPA